MRPQSLESVLNALAHQTAKADEIYIIDGSTDDLTEIIVVTKFSELNIKYVQVAPEQRGLTKQRNVGVALAKDKYDVIIFLDDDVIPESTFLENLLLTFKNPEVIGADGLITNECRWFPIIDINKLPANTMVCDGFYQTLSLRDRIRKIIGLFPLDTQPGITPAYGHGKSALPPSNKQYEVDHLMGCMMAYKSSLFNHIGFSTYFEGYGLYEDYDFSLRAGKFGKLITNTAARLEHHHAPSGRPNTYKYGKMVVRNGWYVWRLKHPHPGIINIFKWHIITLLLMLFRLTNVISMNSETRRQALGDFAGRTVAWFKLIFIKPRPKL